MMQNLIKLFRAKIQKDEAEQAGHKEAYLIVLERILRENADAKNHNGLDADSPTQLVALLANKQSHRRDPA